MSTQSDQVTVDGVRLRVQRAGKGEPMLFLHGAGGAPRWLPFFDQLAAQYELIVPDHPGFGLSDDPAWILSVRDIATLYLDLFEELRMDRLHVVGHDVGGWIAAEIAVRDRSRFRSLTLIAPAGLRLKGVPMGDPFLSAPDEAVRNLYVDQRFADEQLALAPTGEELDRILKNRFTYAKLAWQPRLFDPDLEKWLRRVRIPAQVIWGEGDKLIPADYAELWRQRLANARISRVPQSGHLPHVERPEVVAQLIKDFAKEAAP